MTLRAFRCVAPHKPSGFEKAFADANMVIGLLGARPADAVQTLNQLIYIIDDRELYAAIVEPLKAEGRAPNLVPY